jgi:hypothetical protein
LLHRATKQNGACLAAKKTPDCLQHRFVVSTLHSETTTTTTKPFILKHVGVG